MLYLLDANTLIEAKNRYYPINRVPEFWEWLIFKGGQGLIKVPVEIYDEVTNDNKKNQDDLAKWADRRETRIALLSDEETDIDLMHRVLYGGYVADPSEDDLEEIGRDPFLIAHALQDRDNRAIVTTEVSKPKAQGKNRRIPDVSKDFGISCINTFELIQVLDFKTKWEAEL